MIQQRETATEATFMSDGATYRFDAEAFLPRAIYELIGRLRVADPIAAYKATQTRQP